MNKLSHMIRRRLAPFILRFEDTESIRGAMSLLERSADRSPDREWAMLLLGRELIRRGVVFWA